MKAVIMAGGEGTRLRPITLTRPKPLVPVAGDACIDFVLRALVDADVNDIILTTGYRAGELIRHTGGGSRYGDCNIVYSIEDHPMGTAGGVKKMDRFLDDTFIVASGDVLSDVDFSRLIRFHRESGAEATMALTSVEDPTQFGIVGVDNKGRIERFLEKPAPEQVFSNLINAGIYILEPSVLELIPENTKFDFSKQLFPLLLEQGRPMFATPITGFWKDIGHPFDLIDANLEMIRRQGGSIIHGLHTERSGVSLSDPVMIGADVTLGDNCVIDRAALYPLSEVGERTTVEESVVLTDARIGKGCSIIHSVIGAGTVVNDSCDIRDTIIGDGQEIPAGSELKGVRLPDPSE